MMNRRHALRNLALGTGITAAPLQFESAFAADKTEPWLKFAVQQYSFNRQLKSGELKMESYPMTVVNGTGIKALEYYNGHMEEKAGATDFFKEMRKRSDDLGAVNTMMLCKSKHALDSADESVRAASIESYRPWLDAVKILGGSCIRVDVRSPGDAEEQKKHATAGLKVLSKVAAADYELDILVENHGNHSSNGAWVADVMKMVAMDNCGTLPDFQNFGDYDPYKGVEEMMPWAKIVCAKSKKFDAEGNEVNVDYGRLIKIVKDSGFKGYIGIEFEGHEVTPLEGIKATKALIEREMEKLG
ncbi:sugar phosphate isomerase/epimerase [Verrucomicrobiales bacterium]|nr:sugar phosphate isomerase/epimerase [Verrucomicrobiales bacterium]